MNEAEIHSKEDAVAPRTDARDELSEPPAGEDLVGEQSAFAHPSWALPLVLVMSVPFSILGLLSHPVWLLLGSPFILVLAVWVYVRIVQGRRERNEAIDEDRPPGA